MTAIGGSDIRLGVNPDGVASGLKKAGSDFELFTRKVNSDLANMYKTGADGQRAFRAGIGRLGSELKNLGQQMTLVGTLPALYAGYTSYRDYANIQRMDKGLSLYGETLEDVRRLAKEPNIGIFDSAKSLIGLRAVKLESELAERAVKSFANAITGAGGNQPDLEPALFNLKQFKATRNINQVDLRQLANRIPQTMEVLEKAFGTTDVEKLNKLGIDKFIEGFISGLEKLPKVEELAASASEQAADSFTFFSATLGKGIDKAFGVTSALKGLSQMLDEASDGFNSLSPNMQKAILILGGLVVVIPPIVAAIGGLVALWPLMATGFTAISAAALPIGIIVGLTAALGAFTYMLASGSKETRNLAEQQKYLANSATKLDPLLLKYEELKNKTSLSAKEQNLLKKVTNEIAQLAPSAATGWDKYGNAIDISTGKVKEHTQQQRILLKALQDTRRETLLAENKAADARIKEIDSKLNPKYPRKYVNVGMSAGIMGGIPQFQAQSTAPSDAEIIKYSAELQKLQEQKSKNRAELGSVANVTGERRALRDLENQLAKVNAKKSEQKANGGSFNDIDVLRVEGIKIKAQIDAKQKLLDQIRNELQSTGLPSQPDPAKKDSNGKGGDDGSGGDDDKYDKYFESKFVKRYKKILAEQKKRREEISDITRNIERLEPTGSTLGGTEASVRDRAKAATSTVMGNRVPGSMGQNFEAIEKATQFQSARLAAALDVKQILGSSSSLSDIRDYFEQIPVIANESGDEYRSRLGVFIQASEQLNNVLKGDATLADVRSFFDALPKVAQEGADAFQFRISKVASTMEQLRQSLNSEIENMAEDSAYGFGELLGSLTNGTNGVQAFGQRLLGALGTMAQGMGKALIAAGIGGEALKKMFTNTALMVPAGIALVGVGAALKNSMKSSMNTATMTRLAKGGAAFREMPAIIGDNPNARFDPELVAPASMIDGFIGKSVKDAQARHGGGNVFIPELRIEGPDLVIAFNRQVEINRAFGIG